MPTIIPPVELKRGSVQGPLAPRGACKLLQRGDVVVFLSYFLRFGNFLLTVFDVLRTILFARRTGFGAFRTAAFVRRTGFEDLRTTVFFRRTDGVGIRDEP